MTALTRWLWLTWLGVALSGPAVASAQAPEPEVKLTLDPAMVKGPTTARVVIVEFSDYQ